MHATKRAATQHLAWTTQSSSVRSGSPWNHGKQRGEERSWWHRIRSEVKQNVVAAFTEFPKWELLSNSKNVFFPLTPHAGGDGALRDAVEFILKAQGKWKRIVEAYIGERSPKASQRLSAIISQPIRPR